MGEKLNQPKNPEIGQISFNNLYITDLTEKTISQHASASFYIDSISYQHIFPELLGLNYGVFINSKNAQDFPLVTVLQEHGMLFSTCGCKTEHQQLCEHQTTVLTAILNKELFSYTFSNRKQSRFFHNQKDGVIQK